MSRRPADVVRRRRCAGMSLAELILALASSAFVATAVAAMLHAVAYGAKSGTDLRDLVPKHRVLASRLSDAVRGAEQVLEASTTEVALWTQDADDDGDLDSNEVAWLTYDGTNDTLEYRTADTGHTPYAITAGDVAALDTTLSGGGELATETWGRDLTGFTFHADAAPTATRMVTWWQTFTLGTLSDAQVHAAEVGSHE